MLAQMSVLSSAFAKQHSCRVEYTGGWTDKEPALAVSEERRQELIGFHLASHPPLKSSC